jgi:1,4-alpha-glucan branching enzyme
LLKSTTAELHKKPSILVAQERKCHMIKTNELKATRSTRFSCSAPRANAVFLAGSFNAWKPNVTPMTKDAKGNWSMALMLPPGRYEYKFLVDGRWCCDPASNGGPYQGPDCVGNPFGTQNRVIEVAG